MRNLASRESLAGSLRSDEESSHWRRREHRTEYNGVQHRVDRHHLSLRLRHHKCHPSAALLADMDTLAAPPWIAARMIDAAGSAFPGKMFP